jgi:lysylphosphatidylglycerol synthetase-like protein (DUF2156 family)
VTPDNAWVYAILPFITMALLTAGFVVAYRQRSAARRAALAAHPQRRLAPRPWWSSPWLWLGVGVVSILLAVFVWPWLFALTFVAIPFVWIGRPREEPVDPRSNGHAHRDTGSFMPE